MRLIMLVFLLVLSMVLKAQDHIVQLSYDNDYFNATDRYYTQGVRLEYIAPSLDRSPLRFVLLRSLQPSRVYTGLAIERDGFTPGGIRIVGIPYGNRPYAGTTFVSAFSINYNNKAHTKVFSQLDLGMMGPVVKAKEEQTAIHRAIGNLLPLGWEYQIANDIIANYTFLVEGGFINKPHITLTAFSRVRLGTLYTDISLGSMLRVGWMNEYFEGIGISATQSKRRFSIYGFARGAGNLVGYNATMQGGLFSESIYTLPSSSIKRVVGQGSYGVVMAWKTIRLEYAGYIITPEYKNGLTHGWGHCAFSFCF